MIVYAESSAVLRWLFGEEKGEAIRNHLQNAEKVTCSRLTLIETRRALRRAALEGRLREAEVQEMLGIFAQAAARWSILEMSADVALRAEQRFPSETVRTLDALHLASALALREAVPGLTMVSTDERVAVNAIQLGFDVFPTRS